ncbi:peroxiredoxin-like family protein [Rubrivirga sp. SAORIC476]|uniref:peroxiredoxin-like family protein n=1 Tax=Rubrivirga sp. SAORIC476 TaxID=1961794 RepID=UPI000BA94E5B|nr:peroxiredoxin-like family protein [Rubrivirga sp. SAORIC476]MBC12338.1 alkyl hydroperoxide reductase [Rhodothermaceae bacterium]
MRLLCLALLVALGACAPDPESPAAETAPRADGPTEQAVAIDAEVAANRALGVGDRAPDFALPDATGETVRLSDLLLDGPVVVTFYRGAWCPYCNTQLRDYQQALGSFEATGARLVAISPQAPDSSMSMAERNALAYSVLSDTGGQVSQQYGLVFRVDAETRARYEAVGIDLARYNGGDTDAAWALPVPATYVIDPSGIIRAAFVEADYTQRASPRQVLEALQEVV